VTGSDVKRSFFQQFLERTSAYRLASLLRLESTLSLPVADILKAIAFNTEVTDFGDISYLILEVSLVIRLRSP
jgi:hypothetical protein